MSVQGYMSGSPHGFLKSKPNNKVPPKRFSTLKTHYHSDPVKYMSQYYYFLSKSSVQQGQSQNSCLLGLSIFVLKQNDFASFGGYLTYTGTNLIGQELKLRKSQVGILQILKQIEFSHFNTVKQVCTLKIMEFYNQCQPYSFILFILHFNISEVGMYHMILGFLA